MSCKRTEREVSERRKHHAAAVHPRAESIHTLASKKDAVFVPAFICNLGKGSEIHILECHLADCSFPAEKFLKLFLCVDFPIHGHVSLKAAASDEAAEQGSGRHILVRYRSEIAEEFLQSVRLAVLGTVFRNSHQDTFRMCPQYGEFNEIC